MKSSYPYHKLSRKSFDLVVEMLAGRYSGTRIRELKPRVSVDRLDNTIRGKEGALTLLYHSGGTIPDRGYFALRLKGSQARIGELDEEFVWERKVGDTFGLGTQTWKIAAIDHQKVLVIPWSGPVNSSPFWKAEKGNRDFRFCARLGLFLERWNDKLDTPEFQDCLEKEHFMERPAADELIGFLRRQKDLTGADLPHRHHILIEHSSGPERLSDTGRLIIHTLWGGRLNQPFALALSAAGELLSFVDPEKLESLLRRKLEKTGFFGARFRENAGRSLLLPRSGFNKRMPLWFTRARAKKLLDAVFHYEDFPILVETWRTCLQDEFDLESLKSLLEELERGEIRYSEVNTASPSPFAENLVWRQTNQLMYEGDTPSAGKVSGLSEDILKEVLFSHRLRPRLAPELVSEFEKKLRRTAPGYSPQPDEILDWVKERILIPHAEWEGLLEAVERDRGLPRAELPGLVIARLAGLRLPGSGSTAVAALETVARILKALDLQLEEAGLFPMTETGPFPQKLLPDGSPDDYLTPLLSEWLRFYGPVPVDFIRKTFGISQESLDEVLAGLLEDRVIVFDQLIRGETGFQVCDTENLEALLRLQRREAVPSFKTLPADNLRLFLASVQGLTEPEGLTKPGKSPENLQNVLERLFGYSARAETWQTEIFPARLPDYNGSWLDNLLRQSELEWFGLGRERLSFCFTSDYELFRENGGAGPEPKESLDLLPDRRGKFSFRDILEHTGGNPSDLSKDLWKEVWGGNISCDSFTAVRRGILNRFRAREAERAAETGRSLRGIGRRGMRRRGFNRWKADRPFYGNWYSLEPGPDEPDALEEEELIKDRVRQLLRRYGILFRELLDNELPILKWAGVFRSLRIMELSGEILSGHFFQ